MRIEADAWLSRIFDYPVFKLSLPVESQDGSLFEISSKVLCASAQAKNAFYYAKVPTTHVGLVQLLTATGFTVVDVNVTFERQPAEQPDWTDGRKVIVRDVLPKEHGSVLDIAATCFVYSRFHLDPQIPKQLANAVKREWINSYCHQRRGERLFVAELDGRLAGFNAVLTTTLDGSSVRVIDLIGVANAYQGFGVGKSLVKHFIHDSFSKHKRLRVGTQAANLPSMRLYEGCGFRVAETVYVLHAHVRDGEIRR